MIYVCVCVCVCVYVDVRIVGDVEEVATKLSQVFCEGLYTSTAGLFFSIKLATLYGVKYMVAPYLYLFASFMVVSKLFPVRWGRLNRAVRDNESKYQKAHARIQTHHEAIRALKGEDFELKQVNGSLLEVIKSKAIRAIKTTPNLIAEQLMFKVTALITPLR